MRSTTAGMGGGGGRGGRGGRGGQRSSRGCLSNVSEVPHRSSNFETNTGEAQGECGDLGMFEAPAMPYGPLVKVWSAIRVRLDQKATQRNARSSAKLHGRQTERVSHTERRGADTETFSSTGVQTGSKAEQHRHYGGGISGNNDGSSAVDNTLRAMFAEEYRRRTVAQYDAHAAQVLAASRRAQAAHEQREQAVHRRVGVIPRRREEGGLWEDVAVAQSMLVSQLGCNDVQEMFQTIEYRLEMRRQKQELRAQRAASRWGRWGQQLSAIATETTRAARFVCARFMLPLLRRRWAGRRARVAGQEAMRGLAGRLVDSYKKQQCQHIAAAMVQGVWRRRKGGRASMAGRTVQVSSCCVQALDRDRGARLGLRRHRVAAGITAVCVRLGAACVLVARAQRLLQLRRHTAAAMVQGVWRRRRKRQAAMAIQAVQTLACCVLQAYTRGRGARLGLRRLRVAADTVAVCARRRAACARAHRLREPQWLQEAAQRLEAEGYAQGLERERERVRFNAALFLRRVCVRAERQALVDSKREVQILTEQRRREQREGGRLRKAVQVAHRQQEGQVDREAQTALPKVTACSVQVQTAPLGRGGRQRAALRRRLWNQGCTSITDASQLHRFLTARSYTTREEGGSDDRSDVSSFCTAWE